jgi:uncharacterized membrane protein YjfL (UPF0719 family)
MQNTRTTDELQVDAGMDRRVTSVVGLAHSGTVAGCVLVGFATLGNAVGTGSTGDLLAAAGYGAMALGCAWLARWLSNVIAYPWLWAQVQAGNLAAALVWGANSFGLGLVASHCFALDELANLPVGIVFFFVSHLAVLALKGAFRLLTHYADAEEIQGNNVAAALSHGGLYLALSIIVGHGASGAFFGWRAALVEFAAFLTWAVLLYPVRQLIVVWGLLRHPLGWRSRELDADISRRRLTSTAAIEVLGYLVVAILVAGVA